MTDDTNPTDWSELLDRVDAAVEFAEPLAADLAYELADLPDEYVERLSALANDVRERSSGGTVDLCSIVSARTGGCAEDCSFCVQSVQSSAHCELTPMLSVDEIVVATKAAEARGVHRFCIVTSGGRLSGRDFDTAVAAVGRIRAETSLRRCASLGMLDVGQVEALKEAGLDRYHHNVETCSSFFPQICTTHSWEQRAGVVRLIKESGIETCVGGILNVGESPRQRVQLALELREFDPDSVPVNFLDPRPGTPVQDREPIGALEATKFIAIFRLILPRARIRLAGGRAATFCDDPAAAFRSGADGLLVGSLLTTEGPAVDADLKMLDDLGFDRSAPS